MKDNIYSTITSNGVKPKFANTLNRMPPQENEESIKADTEGSIKVIIKDPNFKPRITKDTFDAFNINRPSENQTSKSSLLDESEEETEFRKKRILTMESSDQALVDANKNLFNRICGKMDEGSIRGAIFTLATMTVGTGCFSMPWIFSKIGFVQGVVFLLVILIITYWMLLLIEEMALKYNKTSYSTLMEVVLGNKIAIALDFLMWICYVMIAISYLLILYKTIGIIIYDFWFFNKSKYLSVDDFLANSYWSEMKIKAIVCFAITLLVLYPLCLIRDYGKFRFLSLLSVVALVYITIVIACQAPLYIIYNSDSNHKKEIHWFSMSEGFTNELLFFQAIACVFFANGNAVCALPIFKDIKDPTPKRIQKVSFRAQCLIGSIYFIVGIFGYLSFPENTPKLFIFRESIFEFDIIMIIGKILLSLSLIVNAGAGFNIIRISGIKLLFRKSSSEITTTINFVFTLITLLFIAMIVTVYDKIINLLSIIGGFIIIILNYFAVGIMYVKGNDLPRYHVKNILTVLISTILLILGWTGGIVSIIDSF